MTHPESNGGSETNAASESTDPRRRKEEASAAALAALAGTAVGGPMGAVIGAALAPLLIPLAQRVWEEVRPEAQARAGRVVGLAAEAAGLDPTQFTARIVNGTEEQRLLAMLAIGAASETANHDKLLGLGRALAAGLAHDDALVDEEVLMVQALADVEAPHLGLLDLMASNVYFAWAGGGKVEPRKDYQTSPVQWTMNHLLAARPNLTGILPTLLNTLERHGLVERQENIEKALEEYSKAAQEAVRRDNMTGRGSSVPRVSSSDLRRVRDLAGWSVLPFGERLLEYVRSGQAPEQWPATSDPEPPADHERE